MSDLLEDAKDAISTMFSDMAVDQATAKERLEELEDFIEDMLISLV